MNAREVIRRPVVTEASMARMNEGRYTFAVDPRANKTEIKNAVETIFKVKVLRVNTMNVMGKTRRRNNTFGKRPDWKKAIVTLSEGQRIEFFDSLQ